MAMFEKLYKRIKADTFLRHNLVFFIGVGGVGFLNYLYHPILGRLLSLEDFGEVEALLSLTAQFGIFLSVLGMMVINISASDNSVEEKNRLISGLRSLALVVSWLSFLTIIAISGYLRGVLSFNSWYPFAVLGILLPLSVSTTVRRSFLQGQRDFKTLSLSGMLDGFSRIFFSVLFVYIGWRTFGAMVGLVITQFVILFYLYTKIKGQFVFANLSFGGVIGTLKTELKYGIIIFVVSMAITTLYTADILVVKYFFSPAEAGLYSGVATIARMIFFLCATVAGVLFPSVSKVNSTEQDRLLLMKAIILIGAIGGLGTLVFSLWPELIVVLLLGPRYSVYSYLLPPLAFMVLVIAFVQLILYYYLALRVSTIMYSAGLSLLLVGILTIWRHQSLLSIVYNFTITAIVWLFMLAGFMIYRRCREIT